MARPHDQNFIIRWLRDLLCGILIGAGAILPGVSGGVLAVVFDIYRPFMEVLTHPKTAIPKYWIWFPPIAVGWCVGFLGFAKGIAAAISISDTVTTWLFSTIQERLSSGPAAKASAFFSAVSLYMASQCFIGMIL